jgi:apolipoprotein N-acyltransferase
MTQIFLPILSAVLLILSSPGFDMWYLGFFGLLPLLFSLEDKKYYFLKVALFSLPYYYFSLFWINSSVSHFGGAPIFIGLLAVFGMALYMSAYIFIFFYLYKKTAKIVTISAVFVIIEMLRGKLFTGFAWLNLGLIPYKADIFTNIYSIFGEYGVSFIIVLFNLSLFKFIRTKKYKNIMPALFVLLLVVTSSFFIKNSEYSKIVKLSIIQPGYRQEDKWLPEKRDEIRQTVISLTKQALKNDSSIIVLPESVFPFFIQADNNTFNTINKFSYEKDILLGNIRYNDNLDYFNSAFLFSRGNFEYYDKIHLVPFGEYFPVKLITAPISKYFFGDAKDFSSGKSLKIFNSKGVKILPLICYESAFYEILFDAFKNDSPEIIAVLSNDSWFGNTTGRAQHLAIDIVRAKEFSRPVVRATQSGISACISEDGKIKGKIDNNIEGILTCDIKIINTRKSIFSQYGYLWFGIVSLFILIMNIKKFKNS